MMGLNLPVLVWLSYHSETGFWGEGLATYNEADHNANTQSRENRFGGVLLDVCFGICMSFTRLHTTMLYLLAGSLLDLLGFCAGCQVHALLVWMGIIKHECEACNNLTWD